MSFPRSYARLGALALVSSVIAACGESTSPLNLDPEQFEAVGESIAMEIEGSTMTLTASGAMQETDPSAPVVFSLGSRTSQRVLGGAAYDLARVRPKMQTGEEECGDPSQEIPTDTDEDGVPDNYTITFRLPECRFVSEESTMDMTGVFRLSDPTPGTAGFNMSFGMDNFRIAMEDSDGRFVVSQDGTQLVSAAASGLSQVLDWAQSASVPGFGGIGMSIDWTNTFAPATGSSIVVGEPLPNGSFSPNGTLRYNEGRRVAVLNVTTVTPLAYDAECAAMYNEGIANSPFTGGEVRGAFSGTQGSGYVRITYAACDWANVVFIGNNVL
jgi:hypothetical protein